MDAALLAAVLKAIVPAPLVPGVPTFGKGRRQVFRTSGTFVSDGTPVRVYLIGAGGSTGSNTPGGGAGAITAIVTPASGNVSVVVGSSPSTSVEVGGNSSFGTGVYLLTANGGGAGSNYNTPSGGGVFSYASGASEVVAARGDGSPSGISGKPAQSGFPAFPNGRSGMYGELGTNGVVIVEY